MPLTCAPVSAVPGRSRTSTEPLGFGESPRKSVCFRQRQRHLGGDDAVDLADGARQRRLDAAHVMHLLDERTDAEALIVEDRPFVAVALGNAARGELQARAADLGGRAPRSPVRLR